LRERVFEDSSYRLRHPELFLAWSRTSFVSHRRAIAAATSIASTETAEKIDAAENRPALFLSSIVFQENSH
jgi:hypothetical protein